MSVAGPGSRLRLIALLSVAAWTVHELRYALAFGGGSGDALRASGHGYLELLCPVIGLVVLAAVGQLLHAVGHAHVAAHGRGPSLLRAWALFTVALIAIFSTQELLEGALTAGHAPGLAGLVGAGGWLAAPLAAACALAVALLVRSADEVIEAAAAHVLRAARATLPSPPPALTSAAALGSRPRPPARHRAGRGPPSLVT